MLLEFEKISRSFGGVRALSGVSFGVQAATIHGLIGPNGSGKTTLMNVVSGLSGADAGRLLFDGRPIHRLRPHRIAALGVARTFQNIRLFSGMSCLENVIAGQHLMGARPLFQRLFRLRSANLAEMKSLADARACLSKAGIAGRESAPAGSLSYGERRRLEIARAMALKPRLLLLDEPIAGMRLREIEEMESLFRSLVASGVTILLIEHNMPFVMRLCHSITVLHFGETVMTGTPGEVAEHPEVIEAYLGGKGERNEG
ncbi:MAG: ABC transporter ATP-binding protein [Syntrophobacteraceae bacterium]|nr:ABC transporter ATP-binding protein [Syntrophobacteraceae bacterium]